MEAAMVMTELAPGFMVPVYFDQNGQLVDAFHDYVVEIAQKKMAQLGPAHIGPKQAYKSTVEFLSGVLLAYQKYLSAHGVDWRKADKNTLQGFRDEEVDNVLKSSNSKGDPKAAKRTVNKKLRWIYHFYAWAQCIAGLIQNRIGPTTKFPIQSTLPLRLAYDDHGIKYISEAEQGKSEFPLTFPNVGESSHTLGQYAATRKDKLNLMKLFTHICSPAIAKRNILIMELADQVGWRESTITYLTTDLFTSGKIEEAQENGLDHIRVKPTVQKNGYDDTFEVPIGLAVRIVRYIEEGKDPANRNAVMKANGWTEKRALNRIFLNLGDDPDQAGKPLGDKRITKIFSQAFKDIGAPENMDAGLHSFRRKFMVEATATEIEVRRQKGLSVAQEDVMHAVARRAGQHNKFSQETYQQAVRDDVRQSTIMEMAERINALEGELTDAELEVAMLRQMLADSEQEVKRLTVMFEAVNGAHGRRHVKHRTLR